MAQAAAALNDPVTRVGEYKTRHTALKNQAQGFFSHYREIAETVLPRARFLALDTNKGEKKHLRIVNNAAGLALRASVAGIVSNLTSPARPWFRLTTPDPERGEQESTRGWLHVVEERMRSMLARTNIYEVLTAFYFDLFAFGTAAFLVDEDDEQVLRGFHLPVGSYVLACSSKGKPDTVIRELSYSVRQMVEKFGKEKCSRNVQEAYARKRYDDPIEVCHLIEPNENYKPGNHLPQFKAYRSCWWEKNASDNDQLLRESGFSEQRLIAARWEVIGEDAYGTNCPGMVALGDAKAVQEYEKVKALVIELLARPPTGVPAGVENASLLPGKITNLPANAAATQVVNLVKVDPAAIAAIIGEIAVLTQRLNRIMLADLWLMLTLGTDGATPGRQMTAEEIRARLEEKLVQVAPVLLRLNDELLHALIDVAFELMLRAGLVPEPPEELQGIELKVEFISMLHQAQQFVALGGIERLAGFVKSLFEINQDVMLKANIFQWVDEYAKTLGLPPNMVLSGEEFARVMEKVQADRKAQALGQGAQIAADAMQKLGNTPVSPDTALSRLAGVTGPIEPTGVTGTPAGAQA